MKLSERFSFFSNILNYIIVLGLILFIAFLFPNHSGFQYDYTEGKAWVYDDLVAEESFGILKSEEETRNEKTKINKQFSSVWKYNQKVKGDILSTFNQRLSDKFKIWSSFDSMPAMRAQQGSYRALGERVINAALEKGILADENYLNSYNPKEINILQDHTSSKKDVDNLLHPGNVRDFIQRQLTFSSLNRASYLEEVIYQSLEPNIVPYPEKNKQFLENRYQELLDTRGAISEGTVIVQQGENIDSETKLIIDSYLASKKGKEVDSWWPFIGYLIITICLIAIFIFYIQLNVSEVYRKRSNLLFLVAWIAIMIYLVSVIDPVDNISTYIIPFCIVPIVIKNFFNDRLALFVHIIIILLASTISELGYEFTFIEIAAGITTLLSLRINVMWNRVFTTIGILLATYIILYFGLSIIRTGNIADFKVFHLLWFFLSTVLTLLAYPLLPLLERLFGFTSDITLDEINDMNHPLIKKLSVEAPGTLQHSLQVGNLGEAAAEAIGADAKLVKVAALYHDVGKANNPAYFIENQSGESPHNNISELESAKIIVAHVTDGLEMAKKHKIPKLIRDFIATHHGSTRVEYFYRTYKQKHPEEDINEADFTYPGPKPSSKEHAIMMLADSLEASCKSLKSPTGEELDEMIHKVINGKLDKEQLAESDLTFSELATITKVFKKMLRSIHHVRIEYPKGNEN